MNFRPELAEKVMAGEKTVTRRLVSDNPRSPWYVGGCSLVEGCDYAICPGRGKHAIGRAEVTSVDVRFLGEIGDEEARREGFKDQRAFDDAWVSINGIWNPLALVWRIGLRALAREST